MGVIRVSELAGELKVKTDVVLDYLVKSGIAEAKPHAILLEAEIADKVREHFPAGDQRKGGGASSQARKIPTIADRARAMGIELHPITRTIEDIKADARKAVAPKKPG